MNFMAKLIGIEYIRFRSFVCIKHQIPLIKHPTNITHLYTYKFIYPKLTDSIDNESSFENKLMDELIGIAEDVKYLLSKISRLLRKIIMLRSMRHS